MATTFNKLTSHSSLHGLEPSGVIALICLARPLPIFIGRGLFFLAKTDGFISTINNKSLNIWLQVNY